jgi:phosphate acetyltransferase
MSTHTFILFSTRINEGLTSSSIGLTRALQALGVSVGFCKPICQHKHNMDSASNQMARNSLNLEPPEGLHIKTALEMLSQGRMDDLMDEVVSRYEAVSKSSDVVIVEGLSPSKENPSAVRLNQALARSLGAEVILVTNAQDGLEAACGRLNVALDNYKGSKNAPVTGYILNQVSQEDWYTLKNDTHYLSLEGLSREHLPCLAAIPYRPSLAAGRVADIVEILDAEIIHRGHLDRRRIQHIEVCARTISNAIDSLKPGTLVVTPGDRIDVVMAAVLLSMAGVQLAGLLLTSNLMPDPRMNKLFMQARVTGLPVLLCKHSTYDATRLLSNRPIGLSPHDQEQVEETLEYFSSHLDTERLQQMVQANIGSQMSPPAFRHQLVKRARSANKRIVLPEGDEPRTIQAAALCQERGIARCVLLGDPVKIRAAAKGLNITLPEGIEILEVDKLREQYVEPMIELRKHKGMNRPLALKNLEDPIVVATMMLATDNVDGMVAGAINTTAATIRPAFQLIKTRKGAKVVSSIFFMLLPDQVVIYGDCAVNPAPTAEELADIALQSLDSAIAFGIEEPRVAMISYSTGDSGTGSDVEKVREATRLAKAARPDAMIDGPMQYDAASVESVGRQKAPDSPVAGRANVFIFPDLNTGNTTYKAVQRSANVISVGPMLQGLNKPVNDLSRGALVEDIVYTIALTAVQAAQNQT